MHACCSSLIFITRARNLFPACLVPQPPNHRNGSLGYLESDSCDNLLYTEAYWKGCVRFFLLISYLDIIIPFILCIPAYSYKLSFCDTVYI